MENILQKFLFPPPPHSAFVAAMLIISFGAYGGFHEIIGKHLQYSKLFNEKKTCRSADKPKAKQPITVAGRVGMLIVYTPAFVFGSASFFLFTDGGLRFFLIRSALTLHFLKRVLEVVLVHRYSGRMGLEAITVVPLGYFFGTAAVIYTQHLSRDFPEPPVDLKYAGILLFVLGITGNFYHHYILSNLRGKGEKEYKIPKGGLFNLVICPHYLFEILVLVGMSFIAQTMYSVSLTMGSVLYLMGRSYATRKWYLSNLKTFPKDIKAIIPYVF
ncbi:hypothetical protein Nepgr_001346 [Nepenthes gracilis]|uniref:3-oxo-5-alpha-steroid 4-dehydrogenase C-terminal domain-containing protein n=1 Tax=Nepenthes gracilis TaxID=150966 RepID=A0AAD3RW08_NEPGR|nr:hypothetical protein Nepgr_001346 [Nepenthes gracilis]